MTFPKLSDLIASGHKLGGRSSRNMKWPMYGGGELDRQAYMTASESGRCSRQIKFRQGSPALPFNRWGYAERGHLIEAWAINLIRDALNDEVEEGGFQLMYYGHNQLSFVDKNQSGTPDGVLVDVLNNEAMVLDIKSLDPRFNWNKLPKLEHYSQVTQNADLINRSGFPYKITHTCIIYIDASDLQKRAEFVEPLDQDQALELWYKANNIAAAQSPADLPAEGMFTEKGCDYCPFTHECSSIVMEENQKSGDARQHERAMKGVFK